MSLSRTILFGLTLAVTAGATGLGFWQVGRLTDRRDRNRLAIAQSTADVVDLSRATLTGRVTYRKVTVRGVYDSSHEFVIRGRLLRGSPGVQIVTPLRIAGRDTALLVNRGFVPTPDAGLPRNPAAYQEPDTVRIEGIAVDLPSEGDGQPINTSGGETWHRLDWAKMGARLPYPIWNYHLIAEADTAKTREHTLRGRVLPIRIDPPPLDDGPHLSYAVQWFMIAGAALGFGIVFVRRDPKADRSALDVPAIPS